jgi:UDP-glucose 4-epimerase
MKYLVTGGAGFIGSQLVDKLNGEVTVVDNLSTGRREFVNKKARFLQLDLSESYVINKLPNEKFDYIFHIAANADVRGGVKDTYVDIKNNILATYHLLEWMKKTGNDTIIFSSTAAVYGEVGKKSVSENSMDFKPISMYGMSKLASEKMLHVYHNNYGFKVNIFRFSNIIGPRNTHGVIRDLIVKLKEDKENVLLLGDGKQIKQYMDVDDCVRGMIDISLKYPMGFEIYNLSHPENTNVDKLAKIVFNEMGVNPKVIYTGNDRGWVGDIPISILNAIKINKLGWFPKMSSEDSIRRTVQYLLKSQDI